MMSTIKSKKFKIVFTILALLAGLFAVVLPMEWMPGVVLFTRFFEVAIPVLLVGALLKYIWCGAGAGCNCDCGCCSVENNKK